MPLLILCPVWNGKYKYIGHIGIYTLSVFNIDQASQDTTQVFVMYDEDL